MRLSLAAALSTWAWVWSKAGDLPRKLIAATLPFMFRNSFHSLRFPGKPTARALNLNPRACIASALPAEPPPQSSPFVKRVALLDILTDPLNVWLSNT